MRASSAREGNWARLVTICFGPNIELSWPRSHRVSLHSGISHVIITNSFPPPFEIAVSRAMPIVTF